MINVWTQNYPFNDPHDVILTSQTAISEMVDHDHNHEWPMHPSKRPFLIDIFLMLMEYRIPLMGNTVEMAGGDIYTHYTCIIPFQNHDHDDVCHW